LYLNHAGRVLLPIIKLLCRPGLNYLRWIQNRNRVKKMRILLAILLISLINLTAYSQFSQNNRASENHKIANELNPVTVAYRLFPTENMWTFIKLNTRNGQMWQVQFDAQGDNRNESYLSLSPLITTENEINDRFTLYPTQNIYTFILLDQVNGKLWQVQWSTKVENRGIIPIN
jgi:uncharacterized membrane protein